MIEVFKTNIENPDHSKMIVEKLLEHFPASKINFDLDDCDNILRVEGTHILPVKIINILQEKGFQCFILE